MNELEPILQDILKVLTEIRDTQARIERNSWPRQMFADGSVQGYEMPQGQSVQQYQSPGTIRHEP